MAANHTALRVERQDLFEDQLRASNTRSVRRASGLVLADHPLGMRRRGMARVSSTSPLHGVCKILVDGTKISAELNNL